MLPWKSNKYYIFQVCVCSLNYPARNAHVPCCIICGLSGSTIFFRISWAARFSVRLYGTQIVLWFSLQLPSETFLILTRTRRNRITNVHRSWCQVPAILVRFETRDFSTDFRRILRHQISRKPVQCKPRSILRTAGRTGRERQIWRS